MATKEQTYAVSPLGQEILNLLRTRGGCKIKRLYHLLSDKNREATLEGRDFPEWFVRDFRHPDKLIKRELRKLQSQDRVRLSTAPGSRFSWFAVREQDEKNLLRPDNPE